MAAMDRTDEDRDKIKRLAPGEVVTGSTDGIGKAYALELAKRGVNIVLISRNQKKLQDVAKEIESKCNVKTKIIIADFSKGQPVFDNIAMELRGISVGILVNNVGCQYTYPMYLAEVPEQELWDIVNVNIGATTMMTRMILPQMQARKRGAIINVSSGSELQPLPLMTVYAASKVFVKSFSDALRYEYQKDGITIQHLSPLFVNTKMNAFSHRLQVTSLFVPDATTYAQNAVNTLGKVNTTTGYWAHGIQVTDQPLAFINVVAQSDVEFQTLLLRNLFSQLDGMNFDSTWFFGFNFISLIAMYFLTVIPPVWIRTWVGGLMNQTFRKDYFKSKPTKL